jgi:Domain of unknown function (DUF1906)
MPPFLGLDTSSYPGDQAMQTLRTQAQIAFTGFYLAPAPSHPNTSWMQKRAFLSGLGYGFAPVYLGQQAASGPGAHNLTAQQGTIDGQNAVQLATQAAFPTQSVLYLDIESGPPLAANYIAYVNAWVAGVSDGDFTPGVYCSHLLAEQVQQLQPDARLWVFKLLFPDGHQFAPPLPTPNPALPDAQTATILQYAQNCPLTVAGLTLNVDLDTATVADPSRP